MTRWGGCVLISLAILPATRADDSPKYHAVATVGMVADIVREVGGSLARVSAIMGSGIDPHLYKPTRSDVALLSRADIIFYNGLMLEGKMADTLARFARSTDVVAVTEALDEQFLLEPPEFKGHYDPHVWMDVSAWSRAVGVVEAALTRHDPEGAELYKRNAAAYRADLDKLHEYVKRVIATIPAEQRVLITAHDAFNYFGRAYAIEVRGIQGLSTASEAGLDDINRLVDYIVDRKIGAVFVETSVADKNVRALVEGAHARGHQVRIGGTLFSDAMGAPGTYEGTYIGMLDSNATSIARALGGEAPERGLNGKLAEHK